MLMQGDTIRYVGNKTSLKKSDRGEVLAPMGGETGVYVIELGGNAYVVAEEDLVKYNASAQDMKAPAKEPDVVQKKSRRRSATEE
jgi:hypothetical protein